MLHGHAGATWMLLANLAEVFEIRRSVCISYILVFSLKSNAVSHNKDET